MREITAPAPFTVGEHDNIVAAVFEHERNDPDAVIFQRQVNGTWTDVTCAAAAAQIRSTALGLIADGVQPGDRVVDNPADTLQEGDLVRISGASAEAAAAHQGATHG